MTDSRILSNVKDAELVEKRRSQMIKGAITLFKEKGFHRTTTREIAKASGFSIGTLYEYIRTKEDVLFLVCNAIYERFRERLEAAIDWNSPPVANLKRVITAYFQLMDDMQEEVIIMYQEVKSLKKETREYVLTKERDMVSMLENVMVTCLPASSSRQDATLLANNIFVQGQMWGFRRWMLQKQFTLETYIERQIHYVLQALAIADPGQAAAQTD
ncbi:TetR/AcrR family transcriptional regulator [Lentibacillus cibarius]|uniref:TetR/AcrR family transcriptional regulator n=1 Tax=Lentibacillus cibarius TaxID=2583219 RepID=A0A549YFX8_9BACI|nr:TetR/AcrR family transcriptional regulator [Lentibacillus cibarius]TMN22024.1 TetR/AcrR family transcriptional regulator [Lentibacillus cibarius]TRM10800.1 TetR/AcrR family transcriptional regulator [Lentibacillus cibarius]